MATISAAANNTSLMYQLAAKGMTAQSAGQDSKPVSTQAANANYAAFVFGADKSKDNQAANGVYELIANGKTSQSNILYGGKDEAAASYISSLGENRAAYNEVLSSYNKTSAMFGAEYKAITGNLKESAAALKGLNFQVKGAADSDTEANTKAALKTVDTFVKDYNETLDLFSDYSGISDRMKDMAEMFADNSARSKGLANIGINMDEKTGRLSVDTEKLSTALKESPANAEYQLGRYGLAGKTESRLAIADTRQDKLFPSLNDMIGKDTARTMAIYSGSSLLNMNTYTMIGNLLNTMG